MPALTTTLDPPGEAPTRAAGRGRAPAPEPRGASLALAWVLLGTVFLGGAVLAFAPGQNVVDSWGFSAFPNVLQSGFLRAMSDLGLAPVTGGVAAVAGLLVWRRDRRRALACVAGPGLAVGMAELLKIVVGRRFEHALCWPSGTTAAVAAVASVIVLVTHGRGRAAAVIVGTAVVIFEAVVLVAFRWHYLSDALGGADLGVGCVVLVDAVFHRLRLPGRRRPWVGPELHLSAAGSDRGSGRGE
jgi:membrane-associated phospholipid phosphatase